MSHGEEIVAKNIFSQKLQEEGLVFPEHLIASYQNNAGDIDLRKIQISLSLRNCHFLLGPSADFLAALCQRQEVEGSFVFHDEDFPPSDESLGLPEDTTGNDLSVSTQETGQEGVVPVPRIIWRAIHDIVPEEGKSEGQVAQPMVLFDGNPSPQTVLEGSLKDCFFIAAVSVAAGNPEMLHQLFWRQELLQCGAMGCRFFQDNQWRLVVVDHQIPCRGTTGRPIFGRTTKKHESWLALLEKAYAKLYGSYGAINGGNVSEALRDLTGCCVLDFNTENAEIRQQIEDGSLWRFLYGRFRRGQVLMGCAWTVNPEEGPKAWNVQGGLLPNHAYSIIGMSESSATPSRPHTSAKQKNTKPDAAAPRQSRPTRASTKKPQAQPSNIRKGGNSKQQPGSLKSSGSTQRPPQGLIRLRNPWGNLKWDRAAEFEKTLEDDQPDNGEFNMPFGEFCRHFNRIYVCILNTASPLGELTAGNFCTTTGIWSRSTAGGCNNFPSWRHNPIFSLRVQQTTSAENEISLLLNISQPDKRKLHRSTGKEVSYNPIGITVVQMCSGAGPMMINGNYKILGRSSFWNKRDVAMELILSAEILAEGVLVVPSTYEPKLGGGFWLSVSAPSPSGVEVMLEDFEWASLYPFSVAAQGHWDEKDETANGRIGNGRPNAWKNPTFILSSECEEDFEIFVFLKHKPKQARKGKGPPQTKQWLRTGIYAIKSLEALSSLKAMGTLDKDDFLGEFKFTNLGEVSRSISIPQCTSERKCILMPATFDSSKAGNFEISIVSKVPIHIEAVKTSDIPNEKPRSKQKKRYKKGQANLIHQLEKAHDANNDVANLYASLGI